MYVLTANIVIWPPLFERWMALSAAWINIYAIGFPNTYPRILESSCLKTMKNLLNHHLKNWLQQLLTRGGCLQDSCQDGGQPGTHDRQLDNDFCWSKVSLGNHWYYHYSVLSNSQLNIHVHAAVTSDTFM